MSASSDDYDARVGKNTRNLLVRTAPETRPVFDPQP